MIGTTCTEYCRDAGRASVVPQSDTQTLLIRYNDTFIDLDGISQAYIFNCIICAIGVGERLTTNGRPYG